MCEDYILGVVVMLANMPGDEVHAILFQIWPTEASEWATRYRHFGWPSSSVIDEVLGIGCHLVRVPHRKSEDETSEFRFSFSHAEVILINIWTPQQQFVYHILRLIQNVASQILSEIFDANETILSTYHLKRLMLRRARNDLWNSGTTTMWRLPSKKSYVDWSSGWWGRPVQTTSFHRITWWTTSKTMINYRKK